MKRQFIFLPLILILLITSCGPSAEEIANQTATAATAIAASWTKTPTPTLTHTPTFTPTITPTPTMTPTITPTPLGGGSGQIALISGAGGASLVNSEGTGMIFLADIPTLSSSSLYAWSPNGRRFAYPGDDGICFTDTSDFSVKCSGVFGEVAWSPNESELAIAGDGIVIVNTESLDKHILVEGVGYSRSTSSPDWSPDGKKIAYQKEGDIYIVRVDDSIEALLIKNANNPIWSPDGTHIAYTIGSSNQQNIIMMNADGTDKVKLTSGQSLIGNGEITWSSDGKHIIYLVSFGSIYSYRNDIYAVEIESHKLISLTKSHNVLGWTLSPDSKMIAYTIGSWESGDCFKSFLIGIDGTVITEYGYPCYSIIGLWRPNSSSDAGVTLSIPSIDCVGNNESAGQVQSNGNDSTSTPTSAQTWEFENYGKLEGWSNILDFAPIQVCNGKLITTSVGGNSWMRSPIFTLNTNAFSKIEVRMKSDTDSPIWLGFITSTDRKFDGPKTTGFDVIGDGQFHNFILDMSKIETWKGVVSQIQLHVVNTQTTVELDYVRILQP